MPPPPTAAAPRLLTPVRLPRRLDGQRLEHLSASSLARFWRCPEAWRAHYLARVRGPESAELRRGWVVDAAIEAHYKALLTTGEALPQRDIEDTYAAAWQRRIDDRRGLIALRAYLASSPRPSGPRARSASSPSRWRPSSSGR